MRKPVVLITGASGEIGHGLIERLAANGAHAVVTLDLRPLARELAPHVQQQFMGSILDNQLLDRILAEYEIDLVFHLAALLSTRGEFAPASAHRVNVEGTMAMLEFAQRQGESHGRPVMFLYPSSIAVYGLDGLAAKTRAGKVKETECTNPTTMYGCNKLYCEHLGRYYARYYRQLAAESLAGKLDFRCLRFPGLISAVTVPSGGTSDYASEMIHAAAQGQPYACFVRPDTRIPFMAMPDGVAALLQLAAADNKRLTQRVYNISALTHPPMNFAPASSRRSPKHKSPFSPTSAASQSSIPGLPTPMTAPPAATGVLHPNTTSNAPSANTSCRILRRRSRSTP